MTVSRPRKPGELPDVQQISRRIRACCMERGWDEVELARRADVSRTTLYNLRQGNCRRPRITTLTSLADAFEMPLERFFGGNLSPLPSRPDPSTREQTALIVGQIKKFRLFTRSILICFSIGTDREWG